MTKAVCGSLAILFVLTLTGCDRPMQSQEIAPTPDPVVPKVADGAAVQQQINAAKAAIADARKLNWIWLHTEKYLRGARAAAEKGELAEASRLAEVAQQEARDAVNQYYLEEAKYLLAETRRGATLNGEQQAVIEAAGTAIRQAQGKRAHELLLTLNARNDRR